MKDILDMEVEKYYNLRKYRYLDLEQSCVSAVTTLRPRGIDDTMCIQLLGCK